jgi:hypothetical protein
MSGQDHSALIPELGILIEIIKSFAERWMFEWIVTEVKETLLE